MTRWTVVAQALDMPGEVVGPVVFAGETFFAVLTIEPEEVARRTSQHLDAVTDRDVLDALAGLPLAHPVAWCDIGEWERLVLDAAAPGLVDERGGWVVRTWRPAVQVNGVLVANSQWAPAVTAASWFWCDARRAAIVDRAPQPRTRAVREARHYGVGLVVDDSTHVDVLALPEPVSVVPDARHWRFLETCYAAWMAGQMSTSQAER